MSPEKAYKQQTFVFSAVGHFYMHFATAMFFTLVLVLEKAWQMPFYELNELWAIGAILVGLVALPAGRLGDTWNAAGMMIIYFLGMGLSVIACGLTSSQGALVITLAGVGLFAAIYHPVGIPWLIFSSEAKTGKLLALNGLFGGLGPAAAAVVTGVLGEFLGWRWAFFIPGVIITLTGLLMLKRFISGKLGSGKLGKKKSESFSKRDALLAFLLLIIAMFTGGLIYHTTQAVLPKFFSERISDFVDGSVWKAGLLVTMIYAVAAVLQILGGHFADRYSLRRVYVLGWFIQIGLLAAMSALAGFSVFFTALLMVALTTGILPAESMLLYNYAPEKHRGLFFGIKYVLAFGAAPISLYFISFVQQATQGFNWIFMSLSLAAALVFLLLFALPSEEPSRLKAQVDY